MAGAPPCRALSFMTHRILYLYRGRSRGEGESGRGLRGAEWRGGYLCASLVCVVSWCPWGALVPCVVCSLYYTKAYQ